MTLRRALIELGKDLFVYVVQRFAAGPASPKPHPRHKVQARPIGERARRAEDRDTPRDNPRGIK